jgi:hypothetical protein
MSIISRETAAVLMPYVDGCPQQVTFAAEPMMKYKISTRTDAPRSPGILDGYLSPEQAALELGVSTRTLARWRAMRIGPPYTYIGQKKLQYRRGAVLAWLQHHEKDPEAEARRRRS